MKKRFAIDTVFVCFFLIEILYGCSKSTESYYPLKEGKTWEYQRSAGSMFGSGGSTKMTAINLEPRELKGKKVTPKKIDAGGQSSFIFIAEDAEGVYEFATQAPWAIEPEIKESPSYLIKYPIKVGTSWDDETKTFLLMGNVPVTLKVIIESIDEVVTVPAGTFKNCVKVKSIGTTKKDMGVFMGVANINVEYYAWYAPGVGNIKFIAKEESDHLMVGSGGEVTIQLDSFKK